MDSGDAGGSDSLKSRVRAPIFWIIIPLVSGYVVARMGLRASPLVLLGFGIVLSVIWTVAWWRRKYRRIYWKAVGVVCIFILSWSYLLLYLPANLDWRELPAREVNLTIKVKEIRAIEDKYDRQGGYAEIVDAPEHLERLIGQRVSFFIYCQEGRSEGLIRSEVVRVRGILTPIFKDSGNGFENYLISQGISFKLDRGRVLETVVQPSDFFKFCAKQNKHLAAILAEGEVGSGGNMKNIYGAMLLGGQGSLTAEQKYEFRTTGSLHLFSISGLHVAIVGGCIGFFLRLVRVPNGLSAIVGLCILFLYVEITGGAPSAMRAFLMVAFYWGAKVFRRKQSAFSALLASGLVALILNPFDLWNIGFQLSYGVVGSILLYGVPLSELVGSWIDNRYSRVYGILRYGLRWVFNLIVISFAANIGGTFLSILYFKTFAPGAVLLSVAVIPLASVVIVIGCASLLLGIIGLSGLSGIINIVSCFIIKMMAVSISFSLTIPGLFWESFTAIPLLTCVSLGAVYLVLYAGHVLNKLRSLAFYTLPVTIIVLFVGFGFLTAL